VKLFGALREETSCDSPKLIRGLLPVLRCEAEPMLSPAAVGSAQEGGGVGILQDSTVPK
jgi:hypothetical protein